MSLRRVWARLRGTFGRGPREADLAAEIESHLQHHIDDNVARGMSAEEARRQAHLQLGGLEATKEAVREQRGVPFLERLAQDARYALRTMRRNPGFAALVIVTLALGIGANTAIFSVVNAVLVEPLPYPEADRIVQVWHTPPQDAFPGRKTFSVSPANYLDWRDQSRSFEALAAYGYTGVTFTNGDRPESVPGAQVTPELFSALRARPMLGRTFGAEEMNAGRDHVVVVSHRFWPGEDPIGKRLTLTFHPDAPWEIVGIVGDVKMNELAAATPTPALYVPLAQQPKQWMSVVVRARQPTAMIPSVAAAIRDIDPEVPLIDPKTLEAVLDESLAQQRFAMTLLSLFAGFALLLAAIGIYSVLSYSVRRRMQEIGIRMALGARRRQILWLVVGHGLRLTVAGLVLGGIGAIAVSHLIAGLLFGVPPTDPVTFVAVAALLTAIALLACYLPARRAMRVDPMVSMRSE